MKYRNFLGRDISQLGFGAMRLPIVGGASSGIDIPATEELIMYAYENGVNYFDSAYVYHGGQSETVLGRIFKDNGIRDKLYIATKLPTFERFIDGDYYELFDEQLKRLQTDYIDFYLIHNLEKRRWKKLKQKKIFNFIEDIKRSGRAKYIGFSFHDDYDTFKKIIDDYDWDFSQIQLNFKDVDYQAGLKGLEYSDSKDIPVVIMEPLRGGQLVSIKDPYVPLLRASQGLEDQSFARICLNFLFDRPEVLTVLSGMNKMEHLIENISAASSMHPGAQPEAEKTFLNAVKIYIESKDTISCTACEYCVSECPQSIYIPGVFETYNDAVMFDGKEKAKKTHERRYANAADCIECGQCENVCPQHLAISELLKKAANYYAD